MILCRVAHRCDHLRGGRYATRVSHPHPSQWVRQSRHLVGLGLAVLLVVGAGVGVAVDRRVPAAAALLAVAAVWPLALVGVSVGEHWPIVVAFSSGAGQVIVAVAMLAGISWVLRCLVRSRDCDMSRLDIGHLALAGIAMLSLINSLFLESTFSSFVILTVLAAIPLGFVGATITVRRIPLSWVVLVGILPVISLLGLLGNAVNPISVGIVSATAIYFVLVNWKRVPRLAGMVVLIAAAYLLLTNGELGPKIAAAAMLATYVFQTRQRSSVLGEGGTSHRRRRSLRAALIPFVVVIGAIGISGAVQELGSSEVNNSTLRGQPGRKQSGVRRLPGAGSPPSRERSKEQLSRSRPIAS